MTLNISVHIQRSSEVGIMVCERSSLHTKVSVSVHCI